MKHSTSMLLLLCSMSCHLVQSRRLQLPTSADVAEVAAPEKPPTGLSPSKPPVPYLPSRGEMAGTEDSPAHLPDDMEEEIEKVFAKRVEEVRKQIPPAVEYVHTLESGSLCWMLTDDQVSSDGPRPALQTELVTGSNKRIDFDAPDLELSVKYRKSKGELKFSILPKGQDDKWEAYYTVKRGRTGYSLGLQEWFIYPGYCKNRVVVRNCNSNAKQRPEPILYMSCSPEVKMETFVGIFRDTKVGRPDENSEVVCFVHREPVERRSNANDDPDFMIELHKGKIVVKSSSNERQGLTNLILLVSQAILPAFPTR